MQTSEIIISIRPEHVRNIMAGRKTVELRRRFPRGPRRRWSDANLCFEPRAGSSWSCTHRDREADDAGGLVALVQGAGLRAA